ncbi:hypothetical protein FRACYDRAFT_233479 [Fragilariopsis cylindrus CCMP1102]|uniref:RNI-like protein n=1 Tax=Fragilariopsis cylindrus CCMP1102 TaxID=635003 RepID=A0A1E7FYS8_9STRA|nr:hypothetical protein FRACYDRAFT_233479 [Fragilariopsis cylindrus CCMP1102]|eukprot:OEU23307.1 hypothetical protein FRACYDRAFT_233479 [Fragilariopsis cylindrus CCMP1102]
MNDTEADAEQRRIVARCMHHMPDSMNIKEAYVLMIMLYKAGILSYYLADLDAADDTGHILDQDGYDQKVEFTNYCSHFNDEQYTKIDPKTGRITFFLHDMSTVPISIDIDQFQSLESICLRYCRLLIMELGNLPVLKTIKFCHCNPSMFENVPEGLQLSSIKKVVIDSTTIYGTRLNSNLSSFLKIFPNTLEELIFSNTTREDSDEILHVLQNDDLCFRHNLTTIHMRDCKLNDDDLKQLVFEIRERFPNLHTLNVSFNNIKSLCGISDRIKQDPSIPNNELCKLNLRLNPIWKQICGKYNPIWKQIYDDDGGGDTLNATKDPKEIAALVTVLDKFDGISNLGAHSSHKYEPKIEYALRINIAGRKELMRGKSSRRSNNADDEDKPIMNRALWPLILERAYSNSSEIYNFERCGWGDVSSSERDEKDDVTISKDVESKKCATGLFHLVHYFYAPVMIEDRGGSTTTTTTATTNITNYNSSESSNSNNNNNDSTRNEWKGKRKRK